MTCMIWLAGSRISATFRIPYLRLQLPFKVGDQQQFWISNVDTNQNFQIHATLKYITPHSYFWAQDNVDVNPGDMKTPDGHLRE